MLAPDKHINLLTAFGNTSLSDDGASIFVLEKIKNEFPNLADYKDYFYMDANFINDIEGYKNLIIIDTTKTNKIKAGKYFHHTINNYEESFHLCNFHDSSIKEIIEMGKTLEMNMPVNIHIFTIEIEENKVFSKHFSSTLKKNIENSFINIKKKIIEILN